MSLKETNHYLKNDANYERLMQRSVESSNAIEGIKTKKDDS